MFSRLLFLMTILSLFAGRGIADKAQALFVFGDSFADTGNRNPYNQTVNEPWRRPYGLTWPGYPAGRYSSGKIQTDFWGDILGLPVPIAYELFRSHDCKATAKKIRRGVNFAVGGSGIFQAYGFITVAQQVKQFKKLIAGSHGFDSRKLSRSVVLISVAGNDYGAFLSSRNGSIEGVTDLVKPVVSGIIDGVKELYESRLTNFAVSFVDLFVPCCAEKGGVERCGEVDEVGGALFEVCSNVEEKFQWDMYHPTQQGWNAIMWLYRNGAKEENKTISFIEGRQTLLIGSSMICEKYDQTLQETKRLLDDVNADILAKALDGFVGLHAPFGNPEHDDDELVNIKPI
ncbi:GDSL esterase/lipase At3g09930 [Cryptomeria japonica]|uniref:GDSL esterase/lipase At3g09930 n=1 Tax=Cryptomeria japonica TaxID=3369 RepID=UPI0027DA89F1|nr:GDSL esterase/lipase At3g09930 [Cryptomeria japonica]